ncbi:MAG: ABC transporter ATP-binding protein [Leptolyngbyaceae bacterium]|nr:ABC transporter ATP-binding protein [Leptolyngbyaceae bacterium]
MTPSIPDLSVLTARQLTLAYQDKAIVKDLSVAIPKGKITVLIGPNGCGKSTLLRGLARLLKPQGGTVYLNSRAISKLSTREVAQQLSILPQGPTAPEGLTVQELVAQGRYPHQTWWQQWSTQDEEFTEQALLLTGMQELADTPLEQLSGGQRQRAWIAMTLAQDTTTLLLDEPTTFLDLAHQIEILDLLYEFNQTKASTVVMVLHDLNQACRYADYLVVMRQGQVFAQGAPRDVMTATLVSDVFGLESCIIPDPVSGTPLCVPIGRHKSKTSGIR